MLEHIEISNFKSIKNIKLDLGRVNIFIGENGSGKSNILEAIALAGAASSNLLSKEFFTSRGIRFSENESLFYRNKKQIEIEIEIKDRDKLFFHIANSKKRGLYNFFKEGYLNLLSQEMPNFYDLAKVNPNSNVTHLKKTEKINYIRSVEIRLVDILEKTGKFSDELISRFLIYSAEIKALRNFYDEEQITPIGVNGEGLFNTLKGLFTQKSRKEINSISEYLKLIDWFDGMEMKMDNFISEKKLLIKDKYLNNNFNYIDQRSTNEGFLFLLFYLTLFVSDKTPKFFAIDNIEASFNPKLCVELTETLIKLATQYKKQFIATTHNPFILDGLNLEDDTQRLFVVSRSFNGETVVNRIQPKEKLSISLSEAWMRGYLGGLPNNF